MFLVQVFVAIGGRLWYPIHRKRCAAGRRRNHRNINRRYPMSYPKTGEEVYVSLNLSNTMLTGIGILKF